MSAVPCLVLNDDDETLFSFARSGVELSVDTYEASGLRHIADTDH
jgi:hypothetical protein